MTTHFTSGVTNVGAGSTLGRAKMPAPAKYHVYHNDFDTYLASDWTITTTEAGSGNARPPESPLGGSGSFTNSEKMGLNVPSYL